jgi:DNA invertase Pin-like site-specific DNA recombinase
MVEQLPLTVESMNKMKAVELDEKSVVEFATKALATRFKGDELENIKERTRAGREVYKLQGGVFGRPFGTNESERDFLSKPQIKKVITHIDKGLSIRNIAKIADVSPMLVQKTKKIIQKQRISK